MMGNNYHRCHEIIAWLHGREQGRVIRCPICKRSYTRGKYTVLDEAGNLMSERWQESDRPAYCTKFIWTGPMKSTAHLEGDCFPFRCPMCSGIVANMKGEERNSVLHHPPPGGGAYTTIYHPPGYNI